MRTLSVIVLSLLLSASAALAQTLTIATTSNPPTLDPQVTFNGFSFGVTNQVYETLVRRTPKGEIVPGLATAWSYPEPTVLRLALREGVRFHDGSVFDAEAVAASIERFIDPQTAAPGRFVLSALTEVRVVDAYTVDLVTAHPFAPLLAHLAHPVAAIAPAALAERIGREPVGTGPFSFVRWVDGSEIVLRANQDYWGGVPQIAEIVYRIIPEISTQVVELRSGGVDVLFNIPPDNFLALAADPALVSSAFDGWGSTLLGLNLDSPKLADLRVRQALAHAIDKELITEEFLRGLASPGVAPIPPTIAFAADLSEPYPFDPERAVALLEEAGATGLQLTLDVYQNADLEAVAQVLQFSFAEIGVQLDIRVQPFAAYAETLLTDEVEAYLSGWGTPTLDADYALYAFFHSSEIPANNGSRFRDAEIDALLQTGRDVPDDAARAAAYLEVQERTVANANLIALYYPASTYAKRQRLQGEVVAFSWILLDLRQATLVD